MEYNKIDEIRNLYFENSKEAKRGKKLLDKLLISKNSKKLPYLLRHHSEEIISDDETWDRDDVDFFLNFYSIISLSYMIGFIRKNDLDNDIIKDEINRYLGNPTIQKYYTVHYPIVLPQILYQLIANDFDGLPFFKEIPITQDIQDKFFAFHQLNQFIDNDNVYQFLWFLDGGSNDEYDIDDLNKILKEPEKIFKVINGEKNALRLALLGFIEYLIFIEKFAFFLKSIDYKIISSSFWHYHGYWFKKILKHLEDSIIIFFSGIQAFVLKEGSKSQESYDWHRSLRFSEEHYLKLLAFILRPDYEMPLVELNLSLKELSKRKNEKIETRLEKGQRFSNKPLRKPRSFNEE